MPNFIFVNNLRFFGPVSYQDAIPAAQSVENYDNHIPLL